MARLTPRSPAFDFADVPRHWFGGDPVATAIANAANLLFPAGERFFVRSVRKHLDRVDDVALRERVKGFSGQESQHARAHERFFEALRAQGYDVARFLAAYERVAYAWIEPAAGGRLNLATTVALEHWTAVFAEHVLSERVFADADPAVAALLYWHAAEELEHADVAYEVLARIEAGWALRAGGFLGATLGLFGFWVAAAVMFLRRDGVGPLDAARGVARFARRHRVAHVILRRGFVDYLDPRFHPARPGYAELARGGLVAAGVV